MFFFLFQVLQNVDELFNREELSAAPDAGWPDCFNSGVFVFKPSEETYNAILQYALDQGSFDGMSYKITEELFSVVIETTTGNIVSLLIAVNI